jgi:hypothetical protein
VVTKDPAEFCAGADMAFKIRVACSSACDLRGKTVRILPEGTAVKEMRVVLSEFDGQAADTAEVIVKAPTQPGSYTWTISLPACKSHGAPHEPNSVTFRLVVKAHQIFMSAWDLPEPAVQGKPFTIHVGAKCSAGCSLAGLPIVIQDHDHTVATGRLWQEELTQTRGLYWAEQELVAPDEEGLHEWTAVVDPADLPLAHEVVGAAFPFYAARPPDHVATIQVVDKDQATPLGNAFLYLDRRRATTDANGLARIEVAKGTHELSVCRNHYEEFRTTIEVTGDVTVTAALKFDPDIYINGNER